MKKHYTAILLISLVSGILGFSSCKKDSESTEQKISGKWTMKEAIGNYTIMGENHKDTTSFTSADYIQLNTDGTLSISESGEAYSGAWDIVNKKLIISGTDYMDFPNGFDISKLTSSDLQLYYKHTDETGTVEQTLNLKK